MSKNHVPVVGEKLFIMSACGTEIPYTVEAVNEKGTRCVVREARCFFPYPRYFDTLPTHIEDDQNGRKKSLFLAKSGYWKESKAGRYAGVAFFGRYAYQPYLD